MEFQTRTLQWLRVNQPQYVDTLKRMFRRRWDINTVPIAGVPATVPLPPTANGTWYPQDGDLMGSGGQGLCHVWVCVDNTTDRVLDTVVVKKVVGGRAWFHDPQNWHNGVIGGVPREHTIATALHAALLPIDRKYMVAPRGYSQVNVRDNTLKLYSEYAPVGDHGHLIAAQVHTFVPAKKSDHFGSGRRGKHIKDKPFGESFLWYLFQGLAIAADAMERAGIVHADLQDQNLLYGAADRTEFAIWPVPKVHDFGSSHFINNLPPGDHRRNLYGQLMLFEYEPPELGRVGGGNWAVPAPTTQLSGKTNVWAVGCLVLCAMRLQHPLAEQNFRDEPDSVPIADYLNFTTGRREPFQAYHPNGQYSLALRTLVTRCLRFDPANRPTAAQLLADVRRDMAGNLDNQDTYAPANLPVKHLLQLLRPMHDPYKIGKKPKWRLRR